MLATHDVVERCAGTTRRLRSPSRDRALWRYDRESISSPVLVVPGERMRNYPCG
jgi:hypothetical protein